MSRRPLARLLLTACLAQQCAGEALASAVRLARPSLRGTPVSLARPMAGPNLPVLPFSRADRTQALPDAPRPRLQARLARLAVSAEAKRLFEPSTLDSDPGPAQTVLAEDSAPGSLPAPQPSAARTPEPPAPSGAKDLSTMKKAWLAGSLFVAVEVIGALLTGGLALAADAAHGVIDRTLDGVSVASFWWSQKSKAPESRKNRVQAATGMFGAGVIALTGLHILLEAIERLGQPLAAVGIASALLALAGVVGNLLSSLILFKRRDANVSVSGIFWHAATDAVGSLAVLVSGLVAAATGWLWVDPAAALVIVGLIGLTSAKLFRKSLALWRSPVKA